MFEVQPGRHGSIPMHALVTLTAALCAIVLGAGGAVASGDTDEEKIIVRGGDVWVIKDGEVVEGEAGATIMADKLRVIGGDGHKVRIISGAGPSSRVFLGITMSGAQDSDGVRVLSVVPDSAAERAGLREDDVIVSVGGKSVAEPADLSEILADLAPGDRVDVAVERSGERRTYEVELGERPASFALSWSDEEGGPAVIELNETLEGLGHTLEGAPALKLLFGDRASRPKLGVGLTEATPELREHLGGSRDAGVIVSKVMSGMPAQDAGIRVGDLITAVDGQPVSGAADLVRALADKDGRTITIDLVRDGRPISVDVSIPEPEEVDGPRA